jgi:hypothetical protein
MRDVCFRLPQMPCQIIPSFRDGNEGRNGPFDVDLSPLHHDVLQCEPPGVREASDARSQRVDATLVFDRD